MSINKALFTLFISSLLFLDCTSQSEPIENAQWLIGTWENKTPEGNLYETWEKVNDKELFGKSYFLKNTDTVLFETVQLIQKENRLFYIVKTTGQNENLPVSFGSTDITEGRLNFENKEHDFPQRITYKKISSDSLFAEISGIQNGKDRKEAFPMKKIK